MLYSRFLAVAVAEQKKKERKKKCFSKIYAFFYGMWSEVAKKFLSCPQLCDTNTNEVLVPFFLPLGTFVDYLYNTNFIYVFLRQRILRVFCFFFTEILLQ